MKHHNRFLKMLALTSVVLSANSFAQDPLVNSAQPASLNTANSDVILFSAEWCGYCQKAKQFLNENDIRFTELDLDQSDDHIDMFEAAGGEGIPYLVVGERKVSGFDKSDYSKVFQL
jgi:glutaredoxin